MRRNTGFPRHVDPDRNTRFAAAPYLRLSKRDAVIVPSVTWIGTTDTENIDIEMTQDLGKEFVTLLVLYDGVQYDVNTLRVIAYEIDLDTSVPDPQEATAPGQFLPLDPEETSISDLTPFTLDVSDSEIWTTYSIIEFNPPSEYEHVSLFAQVGDLVGSSGGSGGSGGAPDGYFNVALESTYTLGTVGTLTLYARGDSPSETSGDNTITVTGDAWKSPSGGTDSNRLTEPVSDTVVATVIGVDIDTDSDNSGFVDETPQEDAVEDDPPGGESVPGNVLHWNHDDDDNNGVEDRLQGPGPLGFDDNDLELALLKVDDVAASAWVAGAAAGYHGLLDGVTLQISHSANLALWRTQDKEPLQLTYQFTAAGAPSNVPDQIYVEGLELGAGTVTWELIVPTPAGAAVTSDTVKFTVVDVNLTIYDGQWGAKVSEYLEESEGAFTVANMNDTDGDTVADLNDTNGVFASPTGRPDDGDLDLMELVLHKPAPDATGAVTLVMDPSMYLRVRLWEDLTMTSPIPITWPEGTVSFSTAVLDKTIYVELTDESAALRDYTFRLRYENIEDVVKATAIWSTVDAVSFADATYADLIVQPPWSELVPGEDPQPILEAAGGSGLLPVPTQIPQLGINGVVNAIWMCFTVGPPGIEDVSRIHFDVTRRIERNIWKLDCNKEILFQAREEDFPERNEEANDDAVGEEDESDEPNANRHMFAVDGPGIGWDWLNPAGDYCVDRFSAEEFMRVGINVVGEGNGIRGSRGSEKYEWHVNHTLVDDGTGHWERDTTGVNDIGPGDNLVWVDDPFPWDDDDPCS